ncbi:hypothetical protein SAMN05518672_107101 [Chitinophaga sp. CF118]|uniref:hypothetical protein n=1 Tax=Chitinophaga sp. CF118 TaxID=1884367 RepID=UPI0008F37CCC|nr:hypothetical protein [Chitinophaga sp. CF118]SFE52746.1 hypothetical protein SAMN05518672_107101 [Chitinophaga sp. CF118]
MLYVCKVYHLIYLPERVGTRLNILPGLLIYCCLMMLSLTAKGERVYSIKNVQSVDTVPVKEENVPVLGIDLKSIRLFDTVSTKGLSRPISGIIPQNIKLLDSVQTKPGSKNWFRRMKEYRDSMRNKQYRDSIIRKVTRQNIPEPELNDSVIIKSEKYFTPFSGRVIRDIYYRKVNVFGPDNIKDTAFTTSMKLIHLANRLHYSSEEWVIRQSLFFRQGDTINPYEMSDNERYLRNRPFVSDARLYIINAAVSPDSVDLLVVTKDVFEYGIDVSEVTPTAVRATVSNNNLFGAGQELRIGTSWHNNYNPPWGSEIRYTKYNALGTFTDFSAGYTSLNNYNPIDSGVYEGAYYISLNRPLYRSEANWVGGVNLSNHFSINNFNRIDTFYRDYRYQVIDVWGGYNFLKQDKRKAGSRKPNLAFLFRHNNIFFQRTPKQEMFKTSPVYNDRRFYLGEAVVFKQDFFKTHHFFGFGRTEDIPLGYTASISAGWESWNHRRRAYTGIEAQKFWPTRLQGVINASAGISTFWLDNVAEDPVIHAQIEYYSRLFKIGKAMFRQFTYFDYLGNVNPYLYRPLDINNEHGVWGFRGSLMNGYQRLNLRSETVYYSALKVLGFKFNFFTSLQASQLTSNNNNILKNPIYTGIGFGFRVKNENLAINTIKISGNYFPKTPAPIKPFFLEITTIVDFRFDIYGLRAPAFLQFR